MRKHTYIPALCIAFLVFLAVLVTLADTGTKHYALNAAWSWASVAGMGWWFSKTK